MKIKKLVIENYKGIKYLKINDPSELILLIGKNGSGKSTVLQALNDIMLFLCGSTDFFNLGVSITIDLNDYKKNIVNWIDNVRIDDFRKNIEFQTIAYHSSYSPDFLFNFRNEIVLKLSNETQNVQLTINNHFPISNVTDKDIVSVKQEEQILKIMKNVISDFKTSSYVDGYIIGYFLLAWCRSRNRQNNHHPPGIAFLDMEKYNPRNIQLRYGEITNVANQRYRNILDQKWRTSNLGTRLAGIMMTHWADKEDNPELQRKSPVERINNSLDQLIGHATLKSPRPEDETIKVDIRGEILPITELSSGEISLVNFGIDYLEMEVEQGLILIDEPDSHLHYEIQLKFVEFLENLVTIRKNNGNLKPNIWFATHSPALISTVDENSIIVVDIDNEKNAALKFTEREQKLEINPLLKILGITQFLDRRNILFLEGISDPQILRNILYKFKPELMEKWRLIPRSGVDELEEIYELSHKLKEFADETSMENLSNYLELVNFLFDSDNKREHQNYEDNCYIWDFYHLENLIFQEPWISILETQHNMLITDDRSFLDILVEALIHINDEKGYLDEIDIKNHFWAKKIPGREIYVELKKEIQGGFSIEKVINGMINDTNDIKELPSELQNFLIWIEKITKQNQELIF